MLPASLVRPLRRRFGASGRVGPADGSPRDGTEIAQQTRAPAPGVARARDGFVLLIVDDDPLMTDLLPRRLRKVLRADVSIHTATSAEQASDMIVALQPDAVITDFNLRQLRNGIDVLREAERHAPRAVRILFSGHAAREIAGLSQAPIHAYVEKPMRLDELITPVLDAIREATGTDLRGGSQGA